MTLGPQLVLFRGKVLLIATPVAVFKTEYRKLAPIVGGTFVTSCFMASIGLGIGACRRDARTPARRSSRSFSSCRPRRRSFRTVATGDVKRYAILANPMALSRASRTGCSRSRPGDARRSGAPLFRVSRTCT